MLHERLSPIVSTARSVDFVAPASVIGGDDAAGLPGREPLTIREIELLEHLASGACNDALARHLSISVATVRTHLRNINAKLRARNRMHAVTLAYRLDIIEGSRAPAAAGGSGECVLTGREALLVRKLSEGLSNGELAEALSTTVSTVRAHLRSVYRKLEVGNRTQAVASARRLGLLSPPPSAIRPARR